MELLLGQGFAACLNQGCDDLDVGHTGHPGLRAAWEIPVSQLEAISPCSTNVHFLYMSYNSFSSEWLPPESL